MKEIIYNVNQSRIQVNDHNIHSNHWNVAFLIFDSVYPWCHMSVYLSIYWLGINANFKVQQSIQNKFMEKWDNYFKMFILWLGLKMKSYLIKLTTLCILEVSIFITTLSLTHLIQTSWGLLEMKYHIRQIPSDYTMGFFLKCKTAWMKMELWLKFKTNSLYES